MVRIPDTIRTFCDLLAKSRENVPEHIMAVNKMFLNNRSFEDNIDKKRIVTTRQNKRMILFLAS
jgi:hypothetical protein